MSRQEQAAGDDDAMDICSGDDELSSEDESTEAATTALLEQLQRLRTEQERLAQENSALIKSMEGVIQAFQTQQQQPSPPPQGNPNSNQQRPP